MFAPKKLVEQRSGCHENRDRPSDFGLHRQKGEHFQYTRAKYVHGSNKGAQKLSTVSLVFTNPPTLKLKKGPC